MIAMAIGNVWGGRSADKDPNPKKLYTRLLISVPDHLMIRSTSGIAGWLQELGAFPCQKAVQDDEYLLGILLTFVQVPEIDHIFLHLHAYRYNDKVYLSC